MEHADGRGQTLIAEIGIELRQVRRHHQTFVDDVFVGEAADVEFLVTCEGDFGTAASEEQLDAEITFGQAFRRDEYLFDARQALQGETAQNGGIDWNLTPANQGQTLGSNLLVEAGPGRFRLGRVLAEEDHPDGVKRRQIGIEMLLGHGAKKRVRLLHQQAATIAGLTVSVDAAPVSHAGE